MRPRQIGFQCLHDLRMIGLHRAGIDQQFLVQFFAGAQSDHLDGHVAIGIVAIAHGKAG